LRSRRGHRPCHECGRCGERRGGRSLFGLTGRPGAGQAEPEHDRHGEGLQTTIAIRVSWLWLTDRRAAAGRQAEPPARAATGAATESAACPLTPRQPRRLGEHQCSRAAAAGPGDAQRARVHGSLPPGGGSLSVSHSQLTRIAIVVLEALAVAIVLGLGLPGARTAVRPKRERPPPPLAAAAALGDKAGDHGRDASSRAGGKGKPVHPGKATRAAAPVPAAQGTQRAPGPATAVGSEAAAAGIRGRRRPACMERRRPGHTGRRRAPAAVTLAR